jgi:hypothetical protein
MWLDRSVREWGFVFETRWMKRKRKVLGFRVSGLGFRVSGFGFR